MNAIILNQIKTAISHNLDEQAHRIITSHGSYLSKRDIGRLFNFMKKCRKYSYGVCYYIYRVSPFRNAFDPSANHNLSDMMWFAIGNGYAKVVQMLLEDERIDPHVYQNEGIRYASEYGHTEVVRLLLKDGKSDPRWGMNYAIRIACKIGHVDVVRILLEDGRSDPADFDNEAIRDACYRGHTEVVRLLLKDGRTDPCARSNEPIRVASISGYADIVQLLLEDGRSDLRNDIELMETLIQWESFRGHVEIVWLLMEDKRVDPSTDKNEAIRGACIYGHIEVVKLLLTDYRVTNDRKHLMMAADNATLWKYYDIKNLIMEAVKRDV